MEEIPNTLAQDLATLKIRPDRKRTRGESTSSETSDQHLHKQLLSSRSNYLSIIETQPLEHGLPKVLANEPRLMKVLREIIQNGTYLPHIAIEVLMYVYEYIKGSQSRPTSIPLTVEEKPYYSGMRFLATMMSTATRVTSIIARYVVSEQDNTSAWYIGVAMNYQKGSPNNAQLIAAPYFNNLLDKSKGLADFLIFCKRNPNGLEKMKKRCYAVTNVIGDPQKVQEKVAWSSIFHFIKTLKELAEAKEEGSDISRIRVAKLEYPKFQSLEISLSNHYEKTKKCRGYLFNRNSAQEIEQINEFIDSCQDAIEISKQVDNLRVFLNSNRRLFQADIQMLSPKYSQVLQKSISALEKQAQFIVGGRNLVIFMKSEIFSAQRIIYIDPTSLHQIGNTTLRTQAGEHSIPPRSAYQTFVPFLKAATEDDTLTILEDDFNQLFDKINKISNYNAKSWKTRLNDRWHSELIILTWSLNFCIPNHKVYHNRVPSLQEPKYYLCFRTIIPTSKKCCCGCDKLIDAVGDNILELMSSNPNEDLTQSTFVPFRSPNTHRIAFGSWFSMFDWTTFASQRVLYSFLASIEEDFFVALQYGNLQALIDNNEPNSQSEGEV